MASKKSAENLLSTLTDLGLSGSEAAVYAQLVKSSPATGYKVAKAIGKPVANTYKTIASLEEKGAIVVDDSGSRLCRAIPPQEFLARLQRQFDERRARAAGALSALVRSSERSPEDEDPRVYRLHSRSQVMERARVMLARATRCALVDVFPDPLAELADDIDRCAARGIDVVVKPYADITLKRAVVVPIISSERDLPDLWPGHHLNICIDAGESLLALLEPRGDGVIQAIFTASPYLAAIQHYGVQFEFMITHLRDAIYKDADNATLRGILNSYRRFSISQMPGYKTLLTGGRE
jgi:sugar-specific transcriptional regulator TrmB